MRPGNAGCSKVKKGQMTQVRKVRAKQITRKRADYRDGSEFQRSKRSGKLHRFTQIFHHGSARPPSSFRKIKLSQTGILAFKLFDEKLPPQFVRGRHVSSLFQNSCNLLTAKNTTASPAIARALCKLRRRRKQFLGSFCRIFNSVTEMVKYQF